MPGAVYVNVVPSRLPPLNSTVPSPSRSSVTVSTSAVVLTVKATPRGATPDAGAALSAAGGVGTVLTKMAIVSVAVPPPVVAVAVSAVVSGLTATSARKLPFCSAAAAPLTATPTSLVVLCSAPRTSSGPAGTVAPVAGEVIVTRSAASTVIVIASD